jgi:hypothetical protein
VVWHTNALFTPWVSAGKPALSWRKQETFYYNLLVEQVSPVGRYSAPKVSHGTPRENLLLRRCQGRDGRAGPVLSNEFGKGLENIDDASYKLSLKTCGRRDWQCWTRPFMMLCLGGLGVNKVARMTTARSVSSTREVERTANNAG